jgi:sugar lactone lactonase YvrE
VVGLLLIAGILAVLAIPSRPPVQRAPEQLVEAPEPELAMPQEEVTPADPVREAPVAAPVEPVRVAEEFTLPPAPPAEEKKPDAGDAALARKAAAEKAAAEKAAAEKALADKRAAEKAVPARLVVKRRDRRSPEELRMQIEKAPELALDRTPDRADSTIVVATAVQAARAGKPAETTPRMLLARGDLVGLPVLMGDACKIGPTAADHLQGGSLLLRQHLFEATAAGGGGGRVTLTVAGGAAADPRPDPDKLQSALNRDARHNEWQKAEAVPALQQLLMAENERVREVLVEQLTKISGPKASVALAQRALFDLNPGVREQALQSLSSRPVEEYLQTLLDGFKHPWAPVADHAAEALATLKITESVPTLIGLLDHPDPTLPVEKPKAGLVVKEMVRVNHLLNCLMCHAPSLTDSDKVRGFVPPTNQPLPPAFSREYYAQKREGIFVRADVTYLRQDFSAPLEVKNHGKWPGAQRFDFFVRERPANAHEIAVMKTAEKERTPTEHQKAIFFALRELTGQDPGPSVEDWKRSALGRNLTAHRHRAGLVAARGLAADNKGRLLVCDAGPNQVLRVDGEKPVVFVKDATGFNGLALDPKGNLLAAQSLGGRVIRLDAAGVERSVVAEGFKGNRFNQPRQLTVDAHGGIYLCDDPPAANPGEKGAIYYISQHGTVSRLAIDLAKPRGVGVSPDGKRLYVVGGAGQEVMVYPLEAAGLPGKGSVIGHLEVPKGGIPMGGAGMVVDERGNLFVLNPAVNGVQVMNPEGARLRLISLPEMPVACAIGGTDGGPRTVYVLTRTALYRLDPEEAKAPVRAVRAD